jgi:uncharacterized membrane protein YhaH (DUF805 family)
MDMVTASVLPLKNYAKFGGRSTRTEVIGFYVLIMIVGLAANFAARWLGLEPMNAWLEGGLGAIFFLPTLSLFVRRLHDSGRSGWWLLVTWPALVAAAWELIVRPRPFTLHVSLHLPWWAMIPAFLSALAVWVLLLWPDDPDTNRYGHNPRCGLVGEPA